MRIIINLFRGSRRIQTWAFVLYFSRVPEFLHKIANTTQKEQSFKKFLVSQATMRTSRRTALSTLILVGGSASPLLGSEAFAIVPCSAHSITSKKSGTKFKSRQHMLPQDELTFNNHNDDECTEQKDTQLPPLNSMAARVLPVCAASAAVLPSPALAAATSSSTSATIVSALWAYGHFFSILAIVGCLTAERLLVKADMTKEDEDMIVKLDLVYGLMSALLIISGFARATTYGKGGDFYTHEILFWVKMSMGGLWGGLSLFPSLTFYKRNFARKNDEEVPPISEKLAARLQSIINAELSAILSIPILATLMARGVLYSQDFPYQIGLVISLASTGGSFYFYAKQALDWKEE